MRRARVWLIPVSIALGVAVPLVYGGSAGLAALRGLQLPFLALLSLLIALSWLCNGVRLQLLVKAMGVRFGTGAALSMVMACEFAAVVTPFGSGSLPAHVLLMSRRGVTAGQAIAILATDRIVDLFFFLTAIAGLLVFSNAGPLHGDLARWMTAAGIALLPGVGLSAIVIHRRRWSTAYLRRAMASLPWLRDRRRSLARMLVQTREGLRVLLGMSPGSMVLLYLFCMGHWLLRYSILPLLLWEIGQAVSWGYLFIAQGLALFIGQISALPGGGGSVELSLAMLLRPYLSPDVTAASLLSWRVVTFYCSLLAGAPVFLRLVGRAGVASDLEPRT